MAFGSISTTGRFTTNLLMGIRISCLNYRPESKAEPTHKDHTRESNVARYDHWKFHWRHFTAARPRTSSSRQGRQLVCARNSTGIELTPYDPEFAEQMAIAEQVMPADDRDVLRKLAE